MKFTYFCFLSCLVLAVRLSADCGPLPAVGKFLAYTITPHIAKETLSLEVTLRFRLNDVKSAKLILPSSWQGEAELYKGIHDLEAVSPGISIRRTANPTERIVVFSPREVVQLRYSVSQPEGGSNGASFFRGIFNQSYVQLTGHNFLLYPDVSKQSLIPVFIEWKDLPARWVVADSLGLGEACQSANIAPIKIINGLFAAGELRTREIEANGKVINFAIAGKWGFSDESFVDLTQRVLVAERTFWHDKGPHGYLITLVPSGQAMSYAGVALEDSFTVIMLPEQNLDLPIKFLLAHEMFHAWNPAKLGEMSTDHPVYWFSEGLTDYYARLLLFRAGLISQQDYIDEINKTYSEYVTSPAVNVTNKQSAEQFFADPDLQKLPYQRGSLLALRWNQQIRLQSRGNQSLDDAMMDLLRQAAQRPQILNEEFLVSYLTKYGGSTIADDAHKYLDQGQIIPLNPIALGPCISLEEHIVYTFDPGLDLDSLVHDRVIAKIKPESEAYLAGLRDGQQVVEHGEIAAGDSSRPISLTVRDHGSLRHLEYNPRGRSLKIAQYQTQLGSIGTLSPECKSPTTQ